VRVQPSAGRYFAIEPAELIAHTSNWPLASSRPRELSNPKQHEPDRHPVASLRPGRGVTVFSLPNGVDVRLGRTATLKALELIGQWKTPPPLRTGQSRSIVAYLYGTAQLRVFDQQLRHARSKIQMGDKFSNAFKSRVTARAATEVATLELDHSN
jgi:hypothetical protein